jgi:hypothetical protein
MTVIFVKIRNSTFLYSALVPFSLVCTLLMLKRVDNEEVQTPGSQQTPVAKQ